MAVRERLHMRGDLLPLALPFFVDPHMHSAAVQEMKGTSWKPELAPVLEKLLAVFENLQDVAGEGGGAVAGGDSGAVWTPEKILAEVRVLAKVHKLSVGTIFNALRMVVTGTSVGAGIPRTLHTLGRGVVLHRIRAGLDALARADA